MIFFASTVVFTTINATDDSKITALTERVCTLKKQLTEIECTFKQQSSVIVSTLEKQLIELKTKIAASVNVEKVSIATQTPAAFRERERFKLKSTQCGESEYDNLNTQSQNPVVNAPSQPKISISRALGNDENEGDQLCNENVSHAGHSLKENATINDLVDISSDSLPS